MAHSLLTPPTATRPISVFSSKTTTHLPSPASLKVWASKTGSHNKVLEERHIERRILALGLVGAVLGLSTGDGNAKAAARRPPPPPATEKKDPNVSGVLAKVLASKKRKEAMKESMAKLKEKGKPIIQEPSQ
ncbi:hypothetical protein ACJIZ3_017247 [Penstemon smallii]|uniref:Uncharacterized protein n=1 Tax=Penstemon smallii TaxID=265156 RepID=A0ABD3SVS5_9LAMI